MGLYEDKYLTSVVRRAQANDGDAFAELYAMTYERQYNYANRYLSNPDDAWDALQEVYILALRKLDSLRDPLCLNAWLTQINSRICYAMQQDRNCLTGVDFDGEQSDPEADPEFMLLQSADAEAVRRSIGKLPDKQRQAISMRYERQLSLQEIADEMQCSISSVTRYLEKGRDAMHELLKREGV